MMILAYLAAGVGIGWIAWGNGIVFSSLALLLWIGYFTVRKRGDFFALALGYYLGASRGLFYGTATYYGDYLYAVSVYLGAALITSAVWALFWSGEPKRKMLYFLIVQALLIASPVALISWANPLQVAGLFFPSMGFFGLALMVVSAILFYLLHLKKVTFVPIVMAMFVLQGATASAPKIERSITGIKSELGYTESIESDYHRQREFLSIVDETEAKMLLLPESALGLVNDSNRLIWNALRPTQTLFAGGRMAIAGSDKYHNALLRVTSKEITPLYTQRVPVPIAMWRPWEDIGATASFDMTIDPTVKIHGKKAGVLICYEQLIMPTYLHTFAYKPKMLLATSNLWWAKGTSIVEIQKQKVQLWALLFGVSYVFSYNI